MVGDFPDIAFVKAKGVGGVRKTTQLVVIHATDNTASDEAEASYAMHRPDSISAHFYSDEDSVTQAVPLANIAYGCRARGNAISVQFELAGKSNYLSDVTLRKVTSTVRRVCDKYGIPIRKIGPADIRAGVKGICGHADVTLAFPEDHGTHTDPGAKFPWDKFIGYVQGSQDGGPMSRTDDIIYAWSQGIDNAAGVSIEPVKWQVRDFTWQDAVSKKLAELAKPSVDVAELARLIVDELLSRVGGRAG